MQSKLLDFHKEGNGLTYSILAILYLHYFGCIHNDNENHIKINRYIDDIKTINTLSNDILGHPFTQ